jgi:hypothetical protein
VRFRRNRGKILGGEAPRRGGRWTRPQRRQAKQRQDAPTILGMLALALFLLGIVGGFTWQLDRELRGGVLQQEAEARSRPDRVRVADLPAYLPAAFVSVVEPSAAPLGRMRTGETGTSLAREVVRQVHLLPEGVGGEARALAMGPLLEQRTSAGQTLQIYLNRIQMGEHRGHPVYGIWHAAREYFDKRPENLTLSEAATLAGLLLPPRINVPQEKVGAVGARRNEVLEVMLRGELISPAAYTEAIAEPLGFQPGTGEVPMTRIPNGAQPTTPLRLPDRWRPTPAPADSATE